MVLCTLTDFRASVTSSCDKNQSDGVSSRSHMEIKVVYMDWARIKKKLGDVGGGREQLYSLYAQLKKVTYLDKKKGCTITKNNARDKIKNCMEKNLIILYTLQ